MKNNFLKIFALLILSSMLFQFASVEASINNDSTGLAHTFQLSELNPGETIRVSVASDGTEGNDWSTDTPSISADGRFVAFHSRASNLVPDDTNDAHDVFVHDRQTGETTRVSVASDGSQGYDPDWGYYADSMYPSISADGRFVAFQSRANNLVPNDTSHAIDDNVFVHDRQTGETTMISVTLDGSIGNATSVGPSISADGRFVAYHSFATNLVPVETNDDLDVFVYDRQTGETTLVSVASDGTPGNDRSGWASFSPDGRYIVFESIANNLVQGDSNDSWDIFMHDRQTGETTLVSVASDGTPGNDWSLSASISKDGRFVAFSSLANNLIQGDTNDTRDIFVRDLQTGETTRVSVSSDGTQSNGNSFTPSISADGRLVAFESFASNLVPDDTNTFADIFVHDRDKGTTKRVSVDSAGIQGNAHSFGPYLSTDGRFVGFYSYASNLVPDDNNNSPDIFIHYYTPDPPDTDNWDIGFRPFPDGYNFPNYTDIKDTDFTYNDMREIFGDEAVCVPHHGECVIRESAKEYFEYINDIRTDGHCEGMAVTSLRLYVPEYETPENFDPNAWITYSLENTDVVRQYITNYFARQATVEIQSFMSQTRQKTPMEIVEDLKSIMSNTLLDPATLFIYKTSNDGSRYAGHAVTPYSISDLGNNIWRIFIYDNNHPNSLKYIDVDASANSWSYGSYSGNAETNSMGYVPISLREQVHQCPWCINLVLPVPLAMVWYEGDGSLLVESPSGEKMGFFNGEYFEEIENGFVSTILANGSEESETRLYFLPIGDYTLTVSGNNILETGSASVTQFGPNQSVKIGNIPVNGSQTTQINLIGDGTAVSVDTSQNIDAMGVGLITETETSSRILSIENAAITNHNSLNVQIQDQTQKFKIDGSQASGGSYDFNYQLTTTNEEQNFKHSNITILENATHYINFGAWDGQSAILLEIDANSDGVINETILLPNDGTMNSLFLPLIIK